MIARYPGRCAICKEPITPDVDVYDTEQKKSFHEKCLNKADLFSANEAEQLAARLGFVDAADVSSPADVPAGWTMRTLPDAH